MIEVFKLDKKISKIALDKLKTTDTAWIDCTDITKSEADQLREKFKLHPLTTEDLFNARIRIKVEEFDHYSFYVFYALKSASPVDMVEIDFILMKNMIITNHRKQLQSFSTLKDDTQRIARLLTLGPGALFHRLIDKEVDNYIPTLDKIDGKIERLEEELTKGVTPQHMSRILQLKRSLVKIKKFALPQREKLGTLTKGDARFISKKQIPYFRDVFDHAIRVADAVESHRDAIGSTFDMYMSAVSNNMNEVMKILSIFATIALPLTVVSGVYGTNFSVLPGSQGPYGFWIMVGVMTAMMVSMLAYFKRKKWI